MGSTPAASTIYFLLFGILAGKLRPLHLAAALRFVAGHVVCSEGHSYNEERLAELLGRAADGLWTEHV
jgi:hypothetical protein